METISEDRRIVAVLFKHTFEQFVLSMFDHFIVIFHLQLVSNCSQNELRHKPRPIAESNKCTQTETHRQNTNKDKAFQQCVIECGMNLGFKFQRQRNCTADDRAFNEDITIDGTQH